MVVIGLENPPYGEPQAEATRSGKTQKGSYENYITEEMKKEVKGTASNDFANKFIWSGFKYFFDYYVVYSPVKYFKSQGLINKEFNEGIIVNRADFHATEGGISIMSWKNEDATNDSWQLENCLVKKTNKGISETVTNPNNKSGEVWFYQTQGTPDFKHAVLSNQKQNIHAKPYIYKIDDANLKKILPLFAANCYTCKDYTEKEVIMKSGDGGTTYQNDNEFLEDCFIWCCLTDKNKCISDRTRQNEMALEQNSKADQIVDRTSDYRMELIRSWRNVITKAKACEEYNPNYKYGLAQIISDIDINVDTAIIDKNGNFLKKKKNQDLHDAIITLKEELKNFYSDYLEPKLFEYELLK